MDVAKGRSTRGICWYECLYFSFNTAWLQDSSPPYKADGDDVFPFEVPDKPPKCLNSLPLKSLCESPLLSLNKMAGIMS